MTIKKKPHIKESLDVIILAAGKGTRMLSNKPKVLHQIAGQSMLERVMNTALTLSPRNILVVEGHGGNAVVREISEKVHSEKTKISFVKQSTQKGTGHAVKIACPKLISKRTLILFGDVPLISKKSLNKLLRSKTPLSFLSANIANPTGYGRIIKESKGRIRRIVEEKDASKEEKKITSINTGIFLAETQYLKKWVGQIQNKNVQKEYYLTDIVELAVRDKKVVKNVNADSSFEFLGVNDISSLGNLERIYQASEAKRLMTKYGTRLADPARIDVRGTLKCGRDVFIDVNCVFEGNVTLGDEVSIGPNCVIKDSTVGAKSKILAYSYTDHLTAGEKCEIGPYARIRPLSQLDQGAKVGNFVELKASSLGSDSKVNHLSYIGDAKIGARVNIGAGTITCNYDGSTKHVTQINDNAFIGSNSALVAPVIIGKNSTIGAGSTITKDAPAGQLTVSRAKQVSVGNWKKSKKKPRTK